jgi:hypothetical protein
MFDVKSKKCIEYNCLKVPYYNLPTEKSGLYCVNHKKENMINIRNNKCIDCNKYPYFNVPSEKKPLYCREHKKEGMIDVKHKKCMEDNCLKHPSFNVPSERKGLYCFEHKKSSMINVLTNKCQKEKCKNKAIYGFLNNISQYCNIHKENGMINLCLENKCSIPECDEENEGSLNNIKYCIKHFPEKVLDNIKKLCKYCDIRDDLSYICKDCQKIKNKKEWSIVRYLRKVIDTKFEYNSSKMLQGCSKKRPDIYFELNKHSIIVEVDENQHNSYDDICECARINEIVNGIGGKSVIIIRYNPDIIRNKKNKVNINQSERLEILLKTIKEELIKEYDIFCVKLIQLFYDDDYDIYNKIKEEDITIKVTI